MSKDISLDFKIMCEEGTKAMYRNSWRMMFAIFLFILACGSINAYALYTQPVKSVFTAINVGAILVNLLWIMTQLAEYRMCYKISADRILYLTKFKDMDEQSQEDPIQKIYDNIAKATQQKKINDIVPTANVASLDSGNFSLSLSEKENPASANFGTDGT